MSLLSNLTKSWSDPAAAFLCKSMATENDRVIRNQIKIWSNSNYWDDGVPPRYIGVHPASLAMARLMGAASVIAAARRLNLKRTENLVSATLGSFSSWTSENDTLDIPHDLSKDLLDAYIGLVTESYDSAESGLTVLAHSWISAIVTSWGDVALGEQLAVERAEQIILAIENQNSHALQQLQ